MKSRIAALFHEEEGQNIVEFALLLPLLMYVLLGIVQFGFIFAAYLTINNAVREGARWGTIYVYDNTLGGVGSAKPANDAARNNGIVDRLIASRGILNMAARGSSTANFSTTGSGALATTACPAQTPAPLAAGAFYYGDPTNPDVTICYALPDATVMDSDPRRGEYMDVEVWYHQQVFIPLLQQFLPSDPVKGSSFIRIPARITVVIN